MLQYFLSKNFPAETHVHNEGDLYKIVELWGCQFPLYYGYYEPCDRDNPAVEPMPIYPDFTKEPQFTENGYPFVTKMQDICHFYQGKAGPFAECADCMYYLHGDELIGVCTCVQNRRSQPSQDSITQNLLTGGK